MRSTRRRKRKNKRKTRHKRQRKSRDCFNTNIENATLSNKNYRKVLYTDKYQQLVLMSLNVGEYIHKEKHSGSQFFRVESGTGIAEINGRKVALKDGISLIVSPNTYHKIINTSKKHPLKLYSIYSPPQHRRRTVDKRQ
jgi:mannose-6-phosphate isomerase-like protein (cupin superfamily)